MDLVLHIADEYLLDTVWARLHPLNDLPTNTSTVLSAWPRDYVPRQLLSLIVITLIGIHLLYFIFAGLSYQFIFNHDMMRHPRFANNQVKLEIQSSLKAFPGMTLLTLPWFQAEVMGYSRLYDDLSEYGWLYLAFSVPLYVFLCIFAHADTCTASWCLPTISYTGSIAPCIIPCSTKTSTSPTTNG